MTTNGSDRDPAPSVAAPGKGRWRSAVAAVLVGLISIVVGALAWVASLGPAPLGKDLAFSTVVVDRDGRLLRPFALSDGRWRLPVRTEDVDPRFLAALLGYEDRRFHSHGGVDILALARAAGQFTTHRRIVSGASTITMQVARLLEPRAERSLGAKVRQIVRAIALERALGKDAILALYLSLAPYGGNLEGVRAASLAYFGKEPRKLSLSEIALLVALPQSPEARRPDRSAAAARAARDRVLDRLAMRGIVAAADVARAKGEAVVAGRRPMPMLAPHAAETAVAQAPQRCLHRLAIDAPTQQKLQDLARERAVGLGREVSAAILAVDHASGEVIAHVGSSDYFDARRAGQVDMVGALRSPGSTLKPFIYGVGFEDGLIHPETLIEDKPVRYGAYAPENFDLNFLGTVTVRRALQFSLNVPAVAVLDKVGVNRFAARLSQAGGALVLPKGEAPGLAMGLGGVGVRLSDLVKLYAGLARLGTTIDLTERLADPDAVSGALSGAPPRTQRLLDPVAAWYVGKILLGAPPPESAVAGRIAFKTGTSYGYRDAWAVGFDGRRTIGVWVGRADGVPVPGLIGRAAAAPILFDAFARLGRLAPLPQAPRGALMVVNARLPLPLQRFRPGILPSDSASPPPRILFPPDGARLEFAAVPDGPPDPIALKISGGVQPLTVLVNGVPLPAAADRHRLFFRPDGPGFVRLTVMDAVGASNSVMVRLQ